MVQEKQLKELFKYIEQKWDIAVEGSHKTDIKRIFGGVLCEDIMNDTLHEVKAEPEEQKGNCSTFDMSRLVDQKYKPTEQFVKCICTNSLQVENCIRNCGHGEEPEQETVEPTKQPTKPFDKDRFEAMFRAVVASGRTESYEQDFLATNICLEKLDAYYATKEGGNNE